MKKISAQQNFLNSFYDKVSITYYFIGTAYMKHNKKNKNLVMRGGYFKSSISANNIKAISTNTGCFKDYLYEVTV